jgi:hypothetical protein
MRSLYSAFPDATSLLDYDPDHLAGLLIFPFRNLPWRSEATVRRCIRHWVIPYAEEFRAPLEDRLVVVWKRVAAEGLLNLLPDESTNTPLVTSRRVVTSRRGIRHRA